MQPVTQQRPVFDAKTFLSTAGAGREMLYFRKGQTIFAQGDTSDAVFVVQAGSVRLSARSQGGKEATLDILGAEDFVGKDSLAGLPARPVSACALTDSTLLRIEKKAMMHTLARETTLGNLFATYVLTRYMRYQQDLVDQRCNSSEKRLARVLLLQSRLDAQSSRETVTARISHEVLAEMVGTTRSRVCWFMNQFKRAGYIDYTAKSSQLLVRPSLFAFYAHSM
jgi:CRP-like cAMP-binding protein